MDRTARIEEALAHLERTVADLSEVAASQAQEIAALKARVTLLMQRAAERDADETGALPIADRPPPHW